MLRPTRSRACPRVETPGPTVVSGPQPGALRRDRPGRLHRRGRTVDHELPHRSPVGRRNGGVLLVPAAGNGGPRVRRGCTALVRGGVGEARPGRIGRQQHEHDVVRDEPVEVRRVRVLLRTARVRELPVEEPALALEVGDDATQHGVQVLESRRPAAPGLRLLERPPPVVVVRGPGGGAVLGRSAGRLRALDAVHDRARSEVHALLGGAGLEPVERVRVRPATPDRQRQRPAAGHADGSAQCLPVVEPAARRAGQQPARLVCVQDPLLDQSGRVPAPPLVRRPPAPHARAVASPRPWAISLAAIGPGTWRPCRAGAATAGGCRGAGRRRR